MKAVTLVCVALVLAATVGAVSVERARKECKGACQDRRNTPCAGTYKVGLCSGPDNIQCCEPNDDEIEPKKAPASTPNYEGVACKGGKGVCQANSKACNGGSYKSGLCNGPANIQCCFPEEPKKAAPVPTPTPKPVPNFEGVPCKGSKGVCQTNTKACNGGSYKSGLCDGPANVQCCFPEEPKKAAPVPVPTPRPAQNFEGVACKGGKGLCQANSKACNGGSYKSGLCNGPANVQCCMPNEPVKVPTPTPRPAQNFEGVACKGGKGVCQSNSKACNGGSYKSGLCNGPADVQCCMPIENVPVPTPRPSQNFEGVPCKGGKGVCQANSKGCAGGSYKSGLCDGPANVQCCMPHSAPAPTTPTTPSTPHHNFEGVPCKGGKGVCQTSSKACNGGSYKSGLCNGPANIKCCMPHSAPAPTTPTTPAHNFEGVTCKGGKGVCQASDKACNGGSYKSGLCDGPANIKCCLPAGSDAPASSALAPFSLIWQMYPHGEADEVKKHIGGGINAEYITNTCVVRVSRALIYAGMPIAPFRLANKQNMLLVQGGDKKNYALRVREFKEYVQSRFGTPLKYVNAGNGGAIPNDLKGRKGIIMFDVRVWDDASGHFDLWDGGKCAHNCYFDKAKEVWLWPVA